MQKLNVHLSWVTSNHPIEFRVVEDLVLEEEVFVKAFVSWFPLARIFSLKGTKLNIKTTKNPIVDNKSRTFGESFVKSRWLIIFITFGLTLSAGIGEMHFLVSVFEQVLNCQVIVIKDSDGLRHVSIFKGKKYAIIYDDLAWISETMIRERMLQLLCGEVTTNSNIKHLSVFVSKDTCRALTSNYSLHDTHEFRIEAKKSNGGLTCFCFNRRLEVLQERRASGWGP